MHVRHKAEEVEADKHRARGEDGRTDAKEGIQSLLEVEKCSLTSICNAHLPFLTHSRLCCRAIARGQFVISFSDQKL